MYKTQILFTVASMILFSGCANSLAENSMRQSNEYAIQNNLPYKFVKYKENEKATFYSNIEIRGVKGDSAAKNSKMLYDDLLKGFKNNCGYNESDLIETRIVLHKFPVFQEIWVFKDDKSEMSDKTTALGVTLIQVENNGGTDIKVSGSCPAKPSNFVFGK